MTRIELFFFICLTCVDFKICPLHMTFLLKKFKEFTYMRQEVSLENERSFIEMFRYLKSILSAQLSD